MNWKDHIITNHSILGGKPIIKGTRLPVEFILERLADGWTEEMIIENFSSITKEDLQAIFAFSLENLREANMIDLKSANE
jgi:uncharacterized protein (DUF433 family)